MLRVKPSLSTSYEDESAILIHPFSVEGHLGSSQFGAITNRVAMNIYVQVPVESESSLWGNVMDRF